MDERRFWALLSMTDAAVARQLTDSTVLSLLGIAVWHRDYFLPVENGSEDAPAPPRGNAGALRQAMPGAGLVVTDSAAPAVGRWSLPATKTRMSTRRQGDKRWSLFG